MKMLLTSGGLTTFGPPDLFAVWGEWTEISLNFFSEKGYLRRNRGSGVGKDPTEAEAGRGVVGRGQRGLKTGRSGWEAERVSNIGI